MNVIYCKHRIRLSFKVGKLGSFLFCAIVLKPVDGIDEISRLQSCRIWWSDVTVICGHTTISMLWGNTTYCVKLSGEDLSRYWNKIESVGLRKSLYYH